MHQQSRHPPRIASPASSPQTNPTRTNNPRDAGAADGRDGAAMADDGGALTGPSRESVKKLDQIIQNFHAKAAVLILQSRLNVTRTTPSRKGEARKTNKWFQIETDEIDDFRDDLRTWKTCGSFENRPPPMIIEIFLDASRLNSSQTLVVLDDNGKRWDVMEALNDSSDGSPPGSRKRNTQVVLERWKIELKGSPDENVKDFGAKLPTIYKKSIVFFRSLFVTTRLMPAYKLCQQAAAKTLHPAIQVGCRFLTGDSEYGGFDLLRQPLHEGKEAVTDYVFGDLEVPVGRFYASVTHRNDFNFRVDDAESLYSSRFMAVDENFFQPSLPQQGDSRQRGDSRAEIGSLPSKGMSRQAADAYQTYGSLSTFHGAGPLATSPLSALKAVRPIGSDTSSPPETIPTSSGPAPPNSLPISAQTSAARPSLRGADNSGRRTSVSFNPFKAGSLSGSPRIPDADSLASPQSNTRGPGLSAIAQARATRPSLTAGMPASLRGAPQLAEAPMGSSPRPSRYSSSFGHRKGKLSIGGQSRTGDDDQISSGKQSLSSSVAQPGSGLLAEASGGGSSGSLQTDDDNISDFLKALDSRKTLQSFESSKKGEPSMKKTVTPLSKFYQMREANNVLTESMTSSMHLHRSSSSSSRQLTSVPGMVNPASMSASSSPGKPLSPHTPHTPAIPSRLSQDSSVNYQVQPSVRHRGNPGLVGPEAQGEERPLSQEGTNPMDIPLSPRLPHTRRSSSAAQQHRAMMEEDDGDLPFAGHRSISLGTEEREPPTLSALLQLERSATDQGDEGAGLQPAAEIRTSESDRDSRPATANSNVAYRSRYGGSYGRGQTPPSSRGSFGGLSGRYGAGLARGGASGENEADEEPLVFDMSEIDRSRRSTEEGRGGGNAGSNYPDRGGFESTRASRKGW